MKFNDAAGFLLIGVGVALTAAVLVLAVPHDEGAKSFISDLLSTPAYGQSFGVIPPPATVNIAPTTSGGLVNFTLQPAASDNHANIKNGAGQVYHIEASNNSATINYLRLYNAGTGFNGCGSATNLLYKIAIPASTSGAGLVADISAGLAFSTGISICVTSGYATTDTTNATATAMDINIMYK